MGECVSIVISFTHFLHSLASPTSLARQQESPNEMSKKVQDTASDPRMALPVRTVPGSTLLDIENAAKPRVGDKVTVGGKVSSLLYMRMGVWTCAYTR